MQKIGYPEVDTHRYKNAFFTSHFNELAESYREGYLAIPESALAFMRNWLLEHTLQQDKKYGVYKIKKQMVQG